MVLPIQVVLVIHYLSNLERAYYYVFQSPNGHLISFLTKIFSSLMGCRIPCIENLFESKMRTTFQERKLNVFLLKLHKISYGGKNRVLRPNVTFEYMEYIWKYGIHVFDKNHTSNDIATCLYIHQ